MPLLNHPTPPLSPRQPSGLLIALRLVLVIAGLAAWFATQAMLGARPADERFIGDRLLDLLQPANAWLQSSAHARSALLIISSGLIDLLGIYMLGRSIFGQTLRPFVGLVMLFALRQIMQATCVLSPPPEMIWPKDGPGFPSLLVTYSVSNDMFFSGHTALAVYGAIELARLRKWLIPVGIAIALFEIVAVLMLRAHWTMDIYAGAISALLVASLADYVARPVDRSLARLFHKPGPTDPPPPA